MKLILMLLSFLLLASSCFRWGAESKYLKFRDYEQVGDGNNNDSSFFIVKYENIGDYAIVDPYLRMTIKDTSSKWFRFPMFSESGTFPTIPPHSTAEMEFYADNFQFTDAVGKIKFYFSWTNSKGKSSGRRSVR
ncbi:MAG: hypothetical protein IT221_08940 [Fluviicola sp.]|nr:hypothetical protein [Fluviicola sp.]